MENGKKLPRNICQMGERDARMRVYLADDVNIFMKQGSEKDVPSVGVLLGERRRIEGETCLFVQGALVLDEAITPGGGIRVEERLRTSMEEKVAAHFWGMQIVGWYISGETDVSLDLYQCQKIKRQLLLARETLFCIDGPEERQFYWMAGEECLPLLGYYIYYATNRNMQVYMSTMDEEKNEEPQAVGTIYANREVLEKHREVRRQRYSGRFAYGLCAMLTLVLAVSGVFILQKKKEQVGVLQEETQVGVLIQEVQGGVEPTQEETETETLPNP